jgi:hypothetical protein
VCTKTKKILTNLSTEILDVQLFGGEYDNSTLQLWGGKSVIFDYDVTVAVDKDREKDLRVDTYR